MLDQPRRNAFTGLRMSGSKLIDAPAQTGVAASLTWN